MDERQQQRWNGFANFRGRVRSVSATLRGVWNDAVGHTVGMAKSSGQAHAADGDTITVSAIRDESPGDKQMKGRSAAGTKDTDTAGRLREKLSDSRTAAMAGEVLRGTVVFVFGLAAGPLRTYPFGLALMMAQPRMLLFSFVGLLTAALCGGGFGHVTGGVWSLPADILPLMISATVGALLRVTALRHPAWFGIRPRRRGGTVRGRDAGALVEPIAVRAVLAAAAAFAGGVTRLISGHFAPEFLYTALLVTILTPALTVLYSWAFDRGMRYSVYYEAGLGCLLFSATYVLRGVSILGVPLSLCLASLLTLAVSHDGGFLRGGVAGLLCGLGYAPAYAPVMALVGLASGLFWAAGTLFAVAAASVIGVALGIGTGGLASLRYFAPGLLCSLSVGAFMIHRKLLPSVLPCDSPALPKSAEAAAVVAECQQRDMTERMEAMSKALCDLSEVFYTLSDRLRRPGIYDVRRLCHETFAKTCRNCRQCNVCWTKECASTNEAIDRMSRALYENGSCRAEDVPDFLRARCDAADALAASLNLASARQIEAMLQKDKTGVFAMDYASMSKLVAQAVHENDLEYVVNEALSGKLRGALQTLDLGAGCVTVYGKRRLHVLAGGVDPLGIRTDAQTITHACEEICGVRLTPPEFRVTDDYITMSMQAARQFRVERAAAAAGKRGETVSGDGIFMFEGKEDYSYLVISDGMGSGREAALTSRIVGIFLENMLRAGNSIGCSLRMLNDFIRCKNTECFATVDLLEIDLLSGQAAFYKCGSAPSYILRNGSLFKISSNTMPVGITREMNAEEIRFGLEEDDVILMISDGAAEPGDNGQWLTDLLTTAWEDDLSRMTRRVIAAAQHHAQRGDDITAALVRTRRVS